MLFRMSILPVVVTFLKCLVYHLLPKTDAFLLLEHAGGGTTNPLTRRGCCPDPAAMTVGAPRNCLGSETTRIVASHLSTRRKQIRFSLRATSSSSSTTDPRPTPENDDPPDSLSSSNPQDAAELKAVTFCHLPKDQEPDLFADYLMELGACSVSMTDADTGTDAEEPLFGEPATVADPRFLWLAPIWNRCHLTAHFPASHPFLQHNQTALRIVAQDFFQPSSSSSTTTTTLEVSTVPNQDWVIHVQQGWKPILVAQRFLLTFPWHTAEDIHTLQESQSQIVADNKHDWITLQLQGGIAFGTGEHPTTQLCLEWLNEQLLASVRHSRHQIRSILDYGAGSGILGMAACKLLEQQELNGDTGITPTVVRGIDIDVDACFIANANAKTNGIPQFRTYLPPLSFATDDESASLLFKAHTRATAETLWPETDEESPKFDVIVANILAGPLIGLAPVLYDLCQPGGVLGMSGILESQQDDVVQSFVQAGFDNVQVWTPSNQYIKGQDENQNDHGPAVLSQSQWILIEAHRK